METKPQELLWRSSEDDNPLEGSAAKSYTCGFCKKGFSNAQALGGHMNIHRRDRAKLRQFSEENLLALGISKEAKNLPADENEEAGNSNSVSEDFTATHHDQATIRASSKSTSHIDQYLDLELRLGPRGEPPEKSSGSRINTTKDLFRSSSH